MKEEFTRITCDTCKKSTEFKKTEGYPYRLGWHYLFKFEGQVPTNSSFKLARNIERFSANDNHFCSMDCMGVFLKDVIEKVKLPAPEKPVDEEEQSHSWLD